MNILYLDVCCLNRPFDDQSQNRVRLEAEAVVLILSNIEGREWQGINSDAIVQEISQSPDSDHRQRVTIMTEDFAPYIEADETVGDRAQELIGFGFHAMDALHLACAEKGQATAFLTTDDQLLRRARRTAHRLLIRVENPLTWLQGEIENEDIGRYSTGGLGGSET